MTVLCQVAAPMLPLLTERVYRGLTGAESVHLRDWPDAEALLADDDLVRQMDQVRAACSIGLSLRENHKLRTRLPLAKVTLAGPAAAGLRDLAHLLQDELNVKKVEFAADFAAFGSVRLMVDARQLGPRLGPKMKDVLRATRTGDWTLLADGSAEIGGVTLSADDFHERIVPNEGVIGAALPEGSTMVVLDTEVTVELELEGAARDFVRLVQQARKDAGLHVSDRIVLRVEAGDAARTAIETHASYVREQVLAAVFEFAAVDAGMHIGSGPIGSRAGEVARFGLLRSD